MINVSSFRFNALLELRGQKANTLVFQIQVNYFLLDFRSVLLLDFAYLLILIVLKKIEVDKSYFTDLKSHFDNREKRKSGS